MSKPQQQISNGRLHSIAAALQQRKTGIGTVSNVPKPTANHTPPSPPTATANGKPNYPPAKPSPPINSSPPANSSPPTVPRRSQSCSSAEPKSRHDESPETKTEEESATNNSQGVSIEPYVTGLCSFIVPSSHFWYDRIFGRNSSLKLFVEIVGFGILTVMNFVWRTQYLPAVCILTEHLKSGDLQRINNEE